MIEEPDWSISDYLWIGCIISVVIGVLLLVVVKVYDTIRVDLAEFIFCIVFTAIVMALFTLMGWIATRIYGFYIRKRFEHTFARNSSRDTDC